MVVINFEIYVGNQNFYFWMFLFVGSGECFDVSSISSFGCCFDCEKWLKFVRIVLLVYIL